MAGSEPGGANLGPSRKGPLVYGSVFCGVDLTRILELFRKYDPQLIYMSIYLLNDQKIEAICVSVPG